MSELFRLVDSYIPPEFVRIFLIVMLIYIAYQVKQINDKLGGAIHRATKDRIAALSQSSDAIEEWRSRNGSESKE